MKKLLFVFSILLTANSLFSQFNNQNIAFELRYPLPVGDNFINKVADHGYLGLMDLGLDYSIFKINNLGIGINFNTSVLRLSETDVTLTVFSPKAKIDYSLDFHKISIIPSISVGYSNWRFRSKAVMIDQDQNPFTYRYKENFAGLTFKGSAKMLFHSNNRINWYILLAYEFSRIEKSEYAEALNTPYNRNLQLLYPGVGIIWQFNE